MAIQIVHTQDGCLRERFYTKSKNTTKHKWNGNTCISCNITRVTDNESGHIVTRYYTDKGKFISRKAPDCKPL